MTSGVRVELSAAGEKFSGYCAGPTNVGRSAVVVIQEIFGVNSHIRDVCDRFADEGFVALAPDVFHRQQVDVELGYEEADIGVGFGLKEGLNPAEVVADLAACIQWLRDQGASKVAVVGFCMGGLYTYLSAAQLNPDAAVAYYGGGIGDYLDQATTVCCPIMFHFGERDDHIPLEVVASVEAAVSGLTDATVYTYPAEHGFNCDQRGAFDQAASTLAWQRTIDFFRRHLD
ncbi:MAG: dienelactone hydrolase family protein [Gammaproteobacteria bacterium]|nr:MAG: dienelactone hydrolase family protein [Gammaproteobacteria bacterium]